MHQYLAVLKDILENGEDRNTRSGMVRSSFSHVMKFDLSTGRFPAMTTKRLAFKQVVAELLWFLSGSQDVHDLQAMGCHIWDANQEDYAKKGKAKFDGDVGNSYGHNWRKWGQKGVDQLLKLIFNLRQV